MTPEQKPDLPDLPTPELLKKVERTAELTNKVLQLLQSEEKKDLQLHLAAALGALRCILDHMRKTYRISEDDFQRFFGPLVKATENQLNMIMGAVIFVESAKN